MISTRAAQARRFCKNIPEAHDHDQLYGGAFELVGENGLEACGAHVKDASHQVAWFQLGSIGEYGRNISQAAISKPLPKLCRV